MKKILLIMLLFIFLFSFHCFKKKNNTDVETNGNDNVIYTEDNKEGIDFETMKKTIDNSEEMNIDVFFAISVLHKKHISEYVESVDSMTEEEQKMFFENKKKDFFRSIKYSEAEYNNYMENHIEEMNQYINNHKEISEYLISIN